MQAFIRTAARRMRTLTFLSIAAAALITATTPALAADAAYPSAPITLLVPFAPGGSLDATARVLGNKLKDILGQPVVIANRPGAGSAVAARALASAKPDGYTLFITSSSAFGIAHLLVRGHEFQLEDYAPIAGLGIYTSLFAVSESTPTKNLSELVELAAKKPNGLNFCSTGVNGMNHLQLEMFRFAVQKKHPGTKFNMTHVPYNGVSPALLAIKSGDVDACVLPYSALVKNTDGAGLRVIAMQREKRLSMMPNVATTGEQGYTDLDANDQLVTLSAPASTPAPVLSKLEDALRTAMSDPAVLKSLNELEVQPQFVSSENARKWLEEDVRKLNGIIRAAGLSSQ